MKNMMLLCDFYKICHKSMYPNGTTKLYSTWTPRSNQYSPESDKVVWFGLQGFLKELVENFNSMFFNRDIEEVVREYEYYIHNTFDEKADSSHIRELHALGFLPLEVHALDEGTLVPFRVPCATIQNTDNRFAWLTNYLETLWSCSMWLPTTTATTAYAYRKIIERYTKMTSDNPKWGSVGCGDFSYRGMGSNQSAITSGAAFLTSFTKTSTIPCIQYLCENYGADIENDTVGSWSASVEHSCTTSNFAVDCDEETFFLKMCNELYPNKPFSFVSDSYDYFNFLNHIIRKNKQVVLDHSGGIRIRPDSGNPVDIICGNVDITDFDLIRDEHVKSLNDAIDYMHEELVEALREETPHGEYGDDSVTGYFKYDEKYYELDIDIDWDRYDKQYYYIYNTHVSDCSETDLTLEQMGSLRILEDIFGATLNSKGYKVINGNIGLVYGDAITLERCEEICNRMRTMGYAIENCIFGVGSYSLQYKTRDSQGWAYKVTYAEINDKPIMVYKDPKTDRDSGHGMKKSQKGMCRVFLNEDGEIVFEDGICKGDLKPDLNLLQPVFKDGKILREQSLAEIRNRIHGGDF